MCHVIRTLIVNSPRQIIRFLSNLSRFLLLFELAGMQMLYVIAAPLMHLHGVAVAHPVEAGCSSITINCYEAKLVLDSNRD